ncbi:adenosylcobalamin-dependent ribonucleoside-diphosphate reductase [Aestuariivirga litoralis]|uniref:Vitamin B12-dependent ribonucleotide reductase n=1 Tax=Aestuariivirga litoralis TaxID=2650924 RepID=A0A2W2BMD6_9HYPH|nr:adenosylcobalamin-dependent ribonucleoside-diphosphate reductase [Aestuariivirga litoralis]PZF77389.1 adenosylcobalamin-dependent ribonucleoside-diphosphate reductase [Aestuariivirga litoralis]
MHIPARPSLDPIAQEIWSMKYRYSPEDGFNAETNIEDSWRRVAHAVSAAERPDDRLVWADSFYRILKNYRFLPAGRILAGAGTDRQVTLFNCFVMGRIPDSLDGIFTQLKEAALTMQQGGGIGHDFSTLRPRGAPVRGVGADASGPVSFMDVWDAMCRTIMSAGTRRGAMMGTLRCDHPDIEDFVAAKQLAGRLRNFNLSVLVTDAFMAAVKAKAEWPLVFEGDTYRIVSAERLWDKIVRSTYDSAEPGVIFIDRINAENNLSYCETIGATNPCGEQPLPPYGACLLGSLNLTRFVLGPFRENARIDEAALRQTAATAVRFLDNVIDISNFPLPQQRAEALAKRRIGLGITGLADALAMCGLSYGTGEAAEAARQWMAAIEQAAYLSSISLAEERGPFPLFDAGRFGATGHAAGMDRELRSQIARNGIRNGLLTSIAPTGTISLIAGNVSSGIEPIFSIRYQRKVLQPNGSSRSEDVTDYAASLYWQMHGEGAALPPCFVTADQLTPSAHLLMQAAVQKHVDSSISKTINIPEGFPFESFKDVYEEAYELGLKGCTTYRPNAVTGSVLSSGSSLPATVVRDDDQRPRPRDEVLPGMTYKLRWPETDHAIYITINDVVDAGVRRPFEIFINSKNMEHYAWTVALTRMISAVFRRGGEVSFVVDELKAVFDPRGGQWMNGRYVPSLLAAIGGIIERHMIDTGFLDPAQVQTSRSTSGSHPASCPRCGNDALMFQEGCATCLSCGYSKCS